MMVRRTVRCVQHVAAWGRRKGAVHDWPDDDRTWQRVASGVLSIVDQFTVPDGDWPDDDWLDR